MLEQAIADFYESILEHGSITVYVLGEKYFINNHGTGIGYDRSEIEWAEMSTSLPVEYVLL